jgi:hypothetical protein
LTAKIDWSVNAALSWPRMRELHDVLFVDGVRTPFGKAGP